MLARRTLSRVYDLGHDHILWSRQRTVLPNDVMSRIEYGRLRSELFGRKQSILQLHGLFVLAKHLFLSRLIPVCLFVPS